jgi:hypothetical protein
MWGPASQEHSNITGDLLMPDNYSDKRTEVFLCKRRVDASTSQLIEEDIVSLKSAKDSTIELLAKAKKTLGDLK